MTDTPTEPELAPGPVRWHGLVKALGVARNVVEKILAVLVIVLFVGLVAVVTWQVFTREVVNNAAPWTQEAAQYTFVLLAMVAAAYVFAERGHIAVEMLVDKLPPRAQKAMGITIELVVMFFFALVFVWGGLSVAQNAWGQHLASLPLTVGEVYMVMPVAGVLVLVFCITHIIGILAGVEKPTPDFDEFEEAI